MNKRRWSSSCAPLATSQPLNSPLKTTPPKVRINQLPFHSYRPVWEDGSLLVGWFIFISFLLMWHDACFIRDFFNGEIMKQQTQLEHCSAKDHSHPVCIVCICSGERPLSQTHAVVICSNTATVRRESCLMQRWGCKNDTRPMRITVNRKQPVSIIVS